MHSEQEQIIIAKFKRHGQPITRKSLERAVAWLRQSSTHSLDTLLKKLNQLLLENQNHQQNLQHALQILSQGNKTLSSYDDLLEQNRRRSIYPISPYERDSSSWFCERPARWLFEFNAEDKLKMNQTQFKRISENIKEVPKNSMFGIIYENYTNMKEGTRPRLIMQNEVNQLQLTIPSNFNADCVLVPGCAYIAHGKYQGRDLSLTVDYFTLPTMPGQDKNTPLKQKFKQMCENISAAKDTLGFQSKDFVKYDCVYTEPNHQLRPIFVFGNVTINNRTVQRLRRLVDDYPNGLSAIVLLLSGEHHESIDFGVWLKCKVYLVPHVNSDGPRMLPKLPLLKARIPSAKILTNPARLCFEGRQLVLVNYPLIKTIFSQNLFSRQTQNASQESLSLRVAQLVFSQGNVAIAQDYYWPQADYFNINSDSVVVVCDSVASMSWNKSKGKGGMATTGNFQRDGDFLCLMGRSKTMVQFCEQPER